MVLGSDVRYEDRRSGKPPRSDTILLLRLDPDAGAGRGHLDPPRPARAASRASATGCGSTRPTRRRASAARCARSPRLLSAPGRRFEVNHVITADFGGFRRAVDYVGLRVRRHRPGLLQRRHRARAATRRSTSTPGTRSCAAATRSTTSATATRTTTWSARRASRSSSRQLRSAPGTRELVGRGPAPGNLEELAHVFGRYFSHDDTLNSTKEVFKLAKTVLYTAGKPVREVPFRVSTAPDGVNLVASPEQLRRTVDAFLGARARTGRRRVGTARAGTAAAGGRGRLRSSRRGPRARTKRSRERATIGFPFLFPTRQTPGGDDPGRRAAHLPDPRHRRPEARRLPHRRQEGARRRRVLRRPGNGVARPADPRRAARDRPPRRPPAAGLPRRRPDPARRAAHAAGRLLGGEHAHPLAVGRRDARHHRLAAQARRLSPHVPSCARPRRRLGERSPSRSDGGGARDPAMRHGDHRALRCPRHRGGRRPRRRRGARGRLRPPARPRRGRDGARGRGRARRRARRAPPGGRPRAPRPRPAVGHRPALARARARRRRQPPRRPAAVLRERRLRGRDRHARRRDPRPDPRRGPRRRTRRRAADRRRPRPGGAAARRWRASSSPARPRATPRRGPGARESSTSGSSGAAATAARSAAPRSSSPGRPRAASTPASTRPTSPPTDVDAGLFLCQRAGLRVHRLPPLEDGLAPRFLAAREPLAAELLELVGPGPKERRRAAQRAPLSAGSVADAMRRRRAARSCNRRPPGRGVGLAGARPRGDRRRRRAGHRRPRGRRGARRHRGAPDAGALARRAHPDRVLRDRVPGDDPVRPRPLPAHRASRTTRRSPSAGRRSRWSCSPSAW